MVSAPEAPLLWQEDYVLGRAQLHAGRYAKGCPIESEFQTQLYANSLEARCRTRSTQNLDNPQVDRADAANVPRVSCWIDGHESHLGRQSLRRPGAEPSALRGATLDRDRPSLERGSRRIGALRPPGAIEARAALGAPCRKQAIDRALGRVSPLARLARPPRTRSRAPRWLDRTAIVPSPCGLR